jgi:hypothetical protein
VVKGTSSSGFLLKALELFRARRDVRLEKFDGHIAIEYHVGRAEDLTHSSFPN